MGPPRELCGPVRVVNYDDIPPERRKPRRRLPIIDLHNEADQALGTTRRLNFEDEEKE